MAGDTHRSVFNSARHEYYDTVTGRTFAADLVYHLFTRFNTAYVI